MAQYDAAKLLEKGDKVSLGDRSLTVESIGIDWDNFVVTFEFVEISESWTCDVNDWIPREK